MAEKVTVMVLKVDLQCPCCYKKVKRLLCKFPQIRDQVYDEKQNTVTITVVCCSPEKIRDKLCYKGGKTIKSIEIKPPPKPKEPEKPKAPEKPKEPEKPKPAPAPKAPEPASAAPKPSPPPPEPVLVMPIMAAHGYPSIFPLEVCCWPCCEGQARGPCYYGNGRPEPYYDNYGYNNNYGYGGGRPCYASRCDCYLDEKNTSVCTIM